MLRNGSTVSEVQESLGYSSYAYFFKSFKKITGMSPSHYRDKYKIPDAP
jgi:YesN/AraC family two-component response regulator